MRAILATLLIAATFSSGQEVLLGGNGNQTLQSKSPLHQNEAMPDKNNVCLTKHCIAASHRIFQYMDESADPCQVTNNDILPQG